MFFCQILSEMELQEHKLMILFEKEHKYLLCTTKNILTTIFL